MDPTDRWTVDELLKHHSGRLRELRAAGKGYITTARALTEYTGRLCSRSTVRNALKRLEDVAPVPLGPSRPKRPQFEPLDVSPFSSDDVEEPIEELLRRRVAETMRGLKREAARFRVCKMPDKPFGLAIFGDPHLDDQLCRYDVLLKDIEAARSPGVWSISVGDHQNHWVGRLAKKFASQGTTASEGWRLARWFLGSGEGTAGLRWLIVVGGNHDSWSHSVGFDPYGELLRDSAAYYDDAEVRLRLVFGDETEPLTLLVRHDFPGRSWFHASHGPAKAAILDHEADILAAGHLHSWACLQQEVSGGRTPIAIRCRGYKAGDHYARERGFLEQEHGHGAMLVVDPAASGPGRVLMFWDMSKGAAYLQTLREAHDKA